MKQIVIVAVTAAVLCSPASTAASKFRNLMAALLRFETAQFLGLVLSHHTKGEQDR